MSALFLLIPDVPLRDSIAEQIANAKLGTVRVVNTARDVEGGKNPRVVIIDEAAYNKKDIDLWEEEKDKPVILLLGGDTDSEGVTETFAKPFRLGHLLTRLRYYLETAPLLRDHEFVFGRYRLEPQNRRITCDDGIEPIRLTEKETALLVFLAHRTEPATRRDILAAIWGYDERIDTHTLETHIYQLRRKLDREGENWLVNEAGTYRLARGQG